MAQRPHGSGSVWLRPDGRWCVAVSTPSGRRFRYLPKGKKRRDALLLLAQMVTDQAPNKVSAQTLDDLSKAWLKDVAQRVGDNTLRSYRSHVHAHIRRLMGGTPAAGVTPVSVATFQRALIDEGMAPSSVAQVMRVLRLLLEQAVEWELIPANPAKKVKPPRFEQHQPPPMTPALALKILDATATSRYAVAYALMLGCGLRIGEALGLTWADVDLDAGMVHVRQQLDYGLDGVLTLRPVKSKRSVRSLPLPAFVARLLAATPQRSALVVTTARGEPVSEAVVREDFRQWVGQGKGKAWKPTYGVRRPHDLRHGYSTLLDGAGVSERVRMDLLGHTKMDQTMHYTGVPASALQGAARALDAVLG